MLKKILKITAIILAVLLILAFTLPILFKGKILAIVKQQANTHINAKVEFSDVDLSLFRHFPRLALGVENLSIVGTDEFHNDTLISGERIDVAVNLLSLFGGSTMTIYSITIDKPRIHAIVNKEGKANWDITKPDTASTNSTATNTSMHLRSYEIKDGYISYTDIPGNMSSEIDHLNHSGSGDFTSDIFTLHTRTDASSASFTYSGVPYLVNAVAALSADIEINNTIKKYVFKTDDIHVNDLQLATEGYFQFVNDTTYGMDIKFSTPSTEFKTLLSLIPAIYKNDFNKIKTSGKASFNGFVKGEYNSIKIPAYLINLNVDNGFFQYPDLPQPVKNVSIAMKLENPDGITDHTILNISKGHIEFGADPIDFNILFKNPITIQYLDATIRGKLNLADVTRFVKLPVGTRLSGILDANATAKGNLSSITKQQSGPFTANGFIQLNNLNYQSADFPAAIRNGNIHIYFQNPDGVADHTLVQIPAAHIEIGTDPVDFSISLKTPVSNAVFDGKLKGHFNLENVKQFTTLTPGTLVSGVIAGDLSFAGNKTAIDKKEYEKINFSGTLDVKDVHYSSKTYPDPLLVNDAHFAFNPKNIMLSQAHIAYLTSNLTASGTLDNAMGYALQNEPLGGSLNVIADQIDLNRLMSLVPSDTTIVKTDSPPFEVPKNLSFLIQASVNKLHYDKVDYNDVKGQLAINQETIALKDVLMNALEGIIRASGFYSTKKDKLNPEFSFNYDVQHLDIQKTFLAFNTVQKIMPVAQYVSGKMNSQLSMTGKLKKDMSPDLNSLSGKGTLDLIDGVFKNFAPVEKLAQAIHINQLNGTSLKDVKFTFEFANGRVLVKPFHYKVSDIDMEIGGMHGFDQSIDYVIAMKVPRSLMGNDANNLVNSLVLQANNKGVPVKVSDYINLKINMVGTLTNPQLKTGLNSAGTDLSSEVKQQAAVFAKQATDSVKTVVSAKTNEAKDSAVAIKNQAIKDLQKDLGKAIAGQKDSTGSSGKVLETTQKNAEQTLKNTFDNLFSKKKTVKDTTKTK